MVHYRVHACTDVTGFGLLGHACEMAQGSGVELELGAAQIDLIPEAVELARMGILPAGMYRNRTFAQAHVDAGETELCRQDLLYDPQTAGGLLMAVDPATRMPCMRSCAPAFPVLSGLELCGNIRAESGSFCAEKGAGHSLPPNKKTWNLLVKSMFSEVGERGLK